MSIKRKIVIGFFVLCCANAVSAAPDPLEMGRMKAYFNNLYDKSVVRYRFTQPSGSVIDCIDINAQPALSHVKNKKIATPPPFQLQLDQASAPKIEELEGTEVLLKAGVSNNRGMEMFCPLGTVPIMQTTTSNMANFNSLAEMMRKYPGDAGLRSADMQGHLFETKTVSPPAIGPTSLHQYAHAAQYSLPNRGANVTINVWSPYVQASSEFSLGQLWVVKGSGTGLQTLEAGTQKYYGLYGDSNPHLFIYSTSNGYGNQGCYNLQCRRFVQTNNTIVIGGRLSPISTNGGTQYAAQMAYYLYAGNWWLQFQGVWVGYYPGSLFNSAGLANGANVIDFGGEIIDDRTKHSYHTLTDMGSGQYPSAWYLHAAYMRNIYYWNSSNNAFWATGISPSRTNAYCYDVARYNNDVNWHTYLFYGGPGYNSNCL